MWFMRKYLYASLCSVCTSIFILHADGRFSKDKQVNYLTSQTCTEQASCSADQQVRNPEELPIDGSGGTMLKQQDNQVKQK